MEDPLHDICFMAKGQTENQKWMGIWICTTARGWSPVVTFYMDTRVLISSTAFVTLVLAFELIRWRHSAEDGRRMTWNGQGDALNALGIEVEGAIGVGVFHPVMHQLASRKLLGLPLSIIYQVHTLQTRRILAINMRGLVSVILLLAATAPSALAALLAVDYGAEWTKASLVKPGTPFDVLLDKGTMRRIRLARTCLLMLYLTLISRLEKKNDEHRWLEEG